MANRRKYSLLKVSAAVILVLISAALLFKECGNHNKDVAPSHSATVDTEPIEEIKKVEKIENPETTDVLTNESKADIQKSQNHADNDLMALEQMQEEAQELEPAEAQVQEQEIPNNAPPVNVDTEEVKDEAESVPEETVITEATETEVIQNEEYLPGRAVIAFKTNLLWDLLLAPNIELEFPFAKDRFSVMAEWWAPWWVSRNNSWCYQVLYAGLEARVWLGNREKRPSLSGHFLGIYGGGGIFDLERNNVGYQSQFYYSAGITYGYSFPIHHNLRIETSISLGYMNAEYQKYEAVEDGRFLAWQNDGRFSWIGPTKAKVSLVWTIFNKGSRR